MDLVAKPNVTSPVWEHFGFEPNEDGKPKNLDEAVCRICSKKINVMRGNRTNLASHLRTTHRPLYDAMKGTPSTSGGTGSALHQLGVSEGVTKYNRDSSKWRALTTTVTKYLVVEMVPFRTVGKPSFQAMLQSSTSSMNCRAEPIFRKQPFQKCKKRNRSREV
uniref:BED-type domain-containing protein n=1 Tax=Anguilla anguilla TaxID=7936 RepID=A0A0E9X6Q2_ANGAN